MSTSAETSPVRYVLVTGGKGQLGTELQRCAWPQGWAVTTSDLPELDSPIHWSRANYHSAPG